MRNTFTQKIAAVTAAVIVPALVVVVLLGVQPLHAQYLSDVIPAGRGPIASAVNPLTNTVTPATTPPTMSP